MKTNLASRSHRVTFEITPNGFMPVAQKTKPKAPPGSGFITVALYPSSATTSSSKVRS